MFIQTDSTVFSATDLINYLGCRHATFLDLADLRQPMLKAESDPTQELLKKKGLEHERKHLACLRAQGKRVAMIDPYATIDQRIVQTAAAMADGADVIYQGALLDAPWMGYADFLVRVNGKTRLGPYGYEVVDTKLARAAQPKHVVQLCVYSKLLGLVQEQLPALVHVVVGRFYPGVIATFPFSLLRAACAAAAGTFCREPAGGVIRQALRPLRLLPLERALRRPNGTEFDHLSMVANITRHQIAKLEDAGIKTVRALLGLGDGATIPRMPVETLSRLRQQARLQTRKRDTGKDSWELLDAPAGKGFARMPKPDAGDLYFDMEGDPFADDGLEYLFGFAYLDNEERKFKAFWAHSRSEEKQAFEQAVDFIVQRFTKFPDTHVYHYASYEESALKRLSVLHGTREDEIDYLLRRRKLVDLYKVVREAIRISERRYSIKNSKPSTWLPAKMM